MGDRLAKKIGCSENKGVTKMESMRYCAVENTARAVEELFDNWSEDPDVQSAYEFYELIDSIEED